MESARTRSIRCQVTRIRFNSASSDPKSGPASRLLPRRVRFDRTISDDDDDDDDGRRSKAVPSALRSIERSVMRCHIPINPRIRNPPFLV
ncbi:hypothetical protein MUK42_24906 [Musa troglodytarum]|uniref:Uncharacterized protein n=1 Tax=Musa troglodytarum TaxID=320322 RepID=A0A9E7JD91_9LILI|nr:hypothetical protein MUK42_24906 [Musa troglodytarum]